MSTKSDLGESAQRILVPRSLSPTKARCWIEIIALASASACALALIIATLGAVVGEAAGESESRQSIASSPTSTQTYEGMITDAHCGAKHSAAICETAAECARGCVRKGEQFVLVDGDTIYLLEGDLASLTRVAGQRVRVVGKLNGRKISITSVAGL
jgi:hypothetical protein